MTKEQRRISKINHDKAEQYFIEHGLMPAKENRTCKWVLHHIDPSWKYNDIERYIQWNVEDLVPMTHSEHISLHKKGVPIGFTVWNKGLTGIGGYKISEEGRKNISESKKGEKNPMYGKTGTMLGKHHSDEARKKMREAKKDFVPWNKGKKCEQFAGENNGMFGKSALKGRHWKLVDGKHVYYD